VNPYLARLRKQFDALNASIEGIQTRAAEADRDLTEDELRSITEQAEQAKALATQIEDLTEVETRSAKVAALAGQVANALPDTDVPAVDDPADGQHRAGGAQVRDRDPGHYTRGSQHSFFADMYRSSFSDDRDAAQRLAEHHRALTTTGAGVGIVPPKWLTDEYAALTRQGRSLANAVRNIPLGRDPRPMTLPKQTAGADSANPAEQAAENDPTPGADKFATNVDTVIPKPTRGLQTVPRQLLDMSSPAVDALIYGDLIAEYNRQVESKVGIAVIAASGAAVTTFATENAFKGTAPAVPAGDAIVDSAIAVWDARKLAADILAMSIKRWGAFKKLRDTTGRKLILPESAGPMNIDGVGTVQAVGEYEGLAIVVTESLNIGPYPDNFLTLRGADTLLFEGDEMRFRYEERSGPESVELGIWRYTAVLVRYAGQSSKRVQITAA
jgi:HK97 family phage major capsid protein